MATKNLVIRGGTKLKGTINSGTGDSVLTLNAATKILTKIGAIDTSTFLTTTLASSKILVGNGSNVATPVSMSGAITIDNSGATTLSAGIVTNSNVATGAGIVYSKLSLATSILNSDISASAAIVRSKLATGTNNVILINNGSGVLAEASPITGSRVIVSDSSGLPTASGTTTTTLGFLDIGSSLTTLLSNKLAFSSAITPSAGDIITYSGGVWTRLAVGSSGQYLSSTGSAPQWVTVPNGVPTGGSTGQYLAKNTGTDFDTSWNTLTISKVTDITATAAQINVLTTGYYDATSSVQIQLGNKLSTSLAQNAIFVGNNLNLVSQLSAGTNGQVLMIVSGAPTWSTNAPATPLTTKGDIYVYSTINDRLGVGTNGQVLTADSTQATGLKWSTVGGISGLTTNRIPYATSSTTLGDDSALTWNATDNILTINAMRIFTFSGGGLNTFIGSNAGNITMSTADGNTGMGNSVLSALTTGLVNTSFGSLSLSAVSSGGANTAIGYQALKTVTTNQNNTAVGKDALLLSTGTGNIALGALAGDNLTSGDNNTIIGYFIDFPGATTSNQLVIQNAIFGLSNAGTGTTVSTGFIGIGQPAPTYQLHITGNAANKNLLLVEEDAGVNILEIIEAAGVNKVGFFAAAPVAQATTAGAASTFTANTSGIVNDTATWDGYTIGQIVKALRNLGLLA